MESALSELEIFIKNFCRSFKIKVYVSSLTSSTSIDIDLNIFDIDMDIFLIDFAYKFNIDYSKFDWKNHGGYPRDSSWIGLIRLFFGYKNPLAKKLILKFYKPKLFISDLQFAIQTKEFI